METARAYGAWGEKKCMGKTSEGVIRSSFVIDEKGKILALKYKINPTDTATFAVKALTAPAAPKKSQAAKSPKEVKPKPAPAPWVFQQVSQNPGNPAAFTGGTQLAAALSDLFAGQRYAVLATQREGEPYGNLVAFGVSPDLKTLLFATKRATRKYENMIADSRIAILIDNRENEIADIGKAWAVTALGKVEEAVEAEREQWVKVYLGKLPELEPFVGDQDNALMKVHVEKYIAVSGFDNIFELTPRR
jgi:nitroimidazol reductase NimA-like FMN-containing flavoprotein (pyridoxamine 5'-phosphate oxidase superfamily)